MLIVQHRLQFLPMVSVLVRNIIQHGACQPGLHDSFSEFMGESDNDTF